MLRGPELYSKHWLKQPYELMDKAQPDTRMR